MNTMPDTCPHCGQPWNGKRTYSKSEIAKVLKDPSSVDPKILEQINMAEKEGRIDYNQ